MFNVEKNITKQQCKKKVKQWGSGVCENIFFTMSNTASVDMWITNEAQYNATLRRGVQETHHKYKYEQRRNTGN